VCHAADYTRSLCKSARGAVSETHA
jgi:hypothetical protein